MSDLAPFCRQERKLSQHLRLQQPRAQSRRLARLGPRAFQELSLMPWKLLKLRTTGSSKVVL